MPSGFKIRSCTNSANECPDATSTILPSTLMPELQYSHLLPGANFSGSCEYAMASSARVQFGRGAGTSFKPEVCVSKSRRVIGRGALFKVIESTDLLSTSHWFL